MWRSVMNKGNYFFREGIRFYPDGTTEILGNPKQLAGIVEEVMNASSNTNKIDLWGNISVGQLKDDSVGYDPDEDGVVE